MERSAVRRGEAGCRAPLESGTVATGIWSDRGIQAHAAITPDTPAPRHSRRRPRCHPPSMRKVVRKVLRSEATEFRYERETQPQARLGPWRDTLDELLSANGAKPGRERLTLIRRFEELRGRGCEDGYDAVRRYARDWQRRRSSGSVDDSIAVGTPITGRPPAQNRTSGIPAYGSHLGYSTRNRRDGQG